MAFYVRITKVAEDERSATYCFGSGADDAEGTLRFEKMEGKATLIAEMPNDEKGQHFIRAVARLRQEWLAGRYPDVTEWAS